MIPYIKHMYPYVYIFAQTKFNNAFSDYVPEEVVFKGFKESAVQKLLEIQVLAPSCHSHSSEPQRPRSSFSPSA